MYLNGVIRAKIILTIKIPANVIAISDPSPRSVIAWPLIPSIDATRPLSPKALLNRSPKIANDPWITLEPADNTKNPKIVFIVPDTTVPIGFFCNTKPSSAISPTTTDACVRMFLMIKFKTCIFSPHSLFC